MTDRPGGAPSTSRRSGDGTPALEERLATGAAWTFLLRFVDRGAGLVRRVVLARILVPHDFGLFGIALLALATIETFTVTGFERALVQADEADEHLDVAWTVGVVRGFALSAVLFLLSPQIAGFFEEPPAGALVRAIALIPLLGSLPNPGVLHFQRDLDFKTQSLYEGASAMVNVAVTIIYAVLTSSVWALVIGMLAGEAVRVALSYGIHPHRPRWSFEGASVSWLFGYGKWIFASSIFLFLINQGDDIFLAKVVGATALGYYQMAYLVISTPTTELTHVVGRVTFPAYRLLRESTEQLRHAYLTLVQLTSFLSLPVAVLIFLHARPLVHYVFGEVWLPMVPLVRVLAPWGFLRSLGSCAGPLFGGSGRPDITARLTGLHLVTFVPLVVPLTLVYGMEGTAAAVVIAAVLNNPIVDVVALRFVGGRWRDFLAVLSRPFAFTVAAVVVSLPILPWIPNAGLAALASVGVFGAVYAVLVLRFGGQAVDRVVGLVAGRPGQI